MKKIYFGNEKEENILRFNVRTGHITASGVHFFFYSTVFGTSGLMGRDCSIVVAAVKGLFSADLNQYDVESPPVPWRESLFSGNEKRLRFGFYEELSPFPSTPGIKRAMAETMEALKVIL